MISGADFHPTDPPNFQITVFYCDGQVVHRQEQADQRPGVGSLLPPTNRLRQGEQAEPVRLLHPVPSRLRIRPG